jgi:hypothetical protein
MITTVRDMYDLFLDGIKKERISTVPPTGFNRIINEAYDVWYRNKSIQIEQDQKRIDDLQGLRVITDGIHKYGVVILSPIPALDITGNPVYGRNLFPLPIPITNGSDVTINGIVYPEYRRMLGVMFKIQYKGDPCHTDGELSDWKEAFIMRSNQRAEVKKNPFRKPTGSRIYYELLDNIIRLDLGDSNNFGVSMKLDYIKHPKSIYYNAQNPSASIMCELQSDQCTEIVELAVRIYAERVSDPRYQTQLYEQSMRGIGK